MRAESRTARESRHEAPVERSGSIYASQTLIAKPLFEWKLDKEYIDVEAERHGKGKGADLANGNQPAWKRDRQQQPPSPAVKVTGKSKM